MTLDETLDNISKSHISGAKGRPVDFNALITNSHTKTPNEFGFSRGVTLR